MLLPDWPIRTPPQKALLAASVLFGIVCFGTLIYFVERSYGGPPAGPELEKQEHEIADVVFRHQFLHNASGRQQRAQVYFLSLHGKSPSDEFMKRFADHTPPVAKLSQCTEDLDIRDINSDAPGILFRITNIKWITPFRVEVSGGYEERYLSSSGNTYYVEKIDGKWVVVRDELRWIS